MITIDELKVQLADYGKAVKDLEEALAIDASRKRVQELEHTMSRPGFYDDADLSKKVFDEVGDLKGKLSRFEKLQGLYDDAETMLEMLDEEYDPAMIPEAEEAVNTVGTVTFLRPFLQSSSPTAVVQSISCRSVMCGQPTKHSCGAASGSLQMTG